MSTFHHITLPTSKVTSTSYNSLLCLHLMELEFSQPNCITDYCGFFSDFINNLGPTTEPQ
ncbi:hypothetical protein Lalb_Chr16g0390501 [Lupinus albus]|nr:hypothetical protein Lalb_Chr16g0390501 [Lupinus albus]